MALGLAWHQTGQGEVRTDRGRGRVVWRDGSQAPRPLDLAPTKARFRGLGNRLLRR